MNQESKFKEYQSPYLRKKYLPLVSAFFTSKMAKTRDYPGKKHKVDGFKNRTKRLIVADDIRLAYEQCNSIADAAYQMNISQSMFIRYAKTYRNEAGMTYYDLFIERPKSEVPNRQRGSTVGREKIEKILRGDQTNTIKSVTQFRNALVRYGYFREECCNCDYSGRRGRDLESPLLVIFKDGNSANGKQNNVQLYCYNCAFELCDTTTQFINMVRKSNEELDATEQFSTDLQEVPLTKKSSTKSVIHGNTTFDPDDDIMDFLAENGFDFRN